MRFVVAGLAALLGGLGLWALTATGASQCRSCRAVTPRAAQQIASAEAVARREARYKGDAHATITHVERVRLPDADPAHRRWIMIQLKSRRAFDVGCPSSRPGPQGGCGAHYLEIGVRPGDDQFGLMWGLTASEVSAIARARRASRSLRIFPDTPALHIRCTIPRGGPRLPTSRSITGTCTTVVEPSNHVRRVTFYEDFRLTPHSPSNEAGWVVKLDRSGRVRSIREIGQPPQLWR